MALTSVPPWSQKRRPLILQKDGDEVRLLVDGKVAWAGTLGEWSRALAFPDILKQGKPDDAPLSDQADQPA